MCDDRKETIFIRNPVIVVISSIHVIPWMQRGFRALNGITFLIHYLPIKTMGVRKSIFQVALSRFASASLAARICSGVKLGLFVGLLDGSCEVGEATCGLEECVSGEVEGARELEK